MKSEVFAEDIEALLVRLDGVTGARVVATEAGEIDRIFVTVSALSDPPSVRRAITTALMSEYALPIALWRIHVARLRTEDQGRPPIPILHRLAETLEGTTARIVVELQTADGRGRLIGSARGPATQTHLRLAAEATLQALRPLLPTEDRKVAVEDITTVRLAGGLAVVAALGGLSGSGSLVGTARVVGAGEAEAGVTATLDAIAKRIPQSDEAKGAGMKNRREELEALRAEYRRRRGADGPAASSPAPQEGAKGGGPGAEDTTAGLGEIRPERPGGAAEVRAERPAPKRSMEDEYFRYLVDGRVPVDIACHGGYQISRGAIVDFGTYSLMVQTSAGRELIYKHAIVSVRESDPRSDQ